MTSIIAINPFTGLPSVIDSNESMVIEGVDAGGNFLGVVPAGSAPTAALAAPPDDGSGFHSWKWIGNAWFPTRTVLGYRSDLTERVKDRIDNIESNEIRPIRSILLALAASTAPAPADLTALAAQDARIAAFRAFLPQIAAAVTKAGLDTIRTAIAAT